MKKLILIAAALISVNSMALSCHGTEPFWSAQINEESVTFEFAGEEAEVLSSDSVSLNDVECNNGMSDFMYPFEVVIKVGHGSVYGCCGEKL